jgi:hypothetical protein
VRSQTIISAGSRSSLNRSVTYSWNGVSHNSVTDICYDIIDVGAPLGKHISGPNLEKGQDKSWRVCSESSLGNCYLKSTCHAWQYKVLICPNVISGVLLASHRDSRLGDCFPPASVGHTN